MIKINISIIEMLEDIYEQAHNGYMNCQNYNGDGGARRAMEKRIKYYQKLIEEKKLKVVNTPSRRKESVQ